MKSKLQSEFWGFRSGVDGS